MTDFERLVLKALATLIKLHLSGQRLSGTEVDIYSQGSVVKELETAAEDWRTYSQK